MHILSKIVDWAFVAIAIAALIAVTIGAANEVREIVTLLV